MDVECTQLLYQYACIDPWGGGDTCDGTDTVCTVWGNTHVATFDGNENDIYGNAIYILSQTSQDAIDNFGKFLFWVHFGHRRPGFSDRLSENVRKPFEFGRQSIRKGSL